MLEVVGAFFALIVVVALVSVGAILAIGLAFIICATLFALVKPKINHVIDAWSSWIEKRLS